MDSYAVVFHAGYHYFFGGYSSGYLDSILRLNGTSWTWSKIGHLNSSRRAHGVILVGNTFMVVGGYETKKNEACLLDNERFTCTELSSSLTNYRYWPILYQVDENYGNCLITSATGTTTKEQTTTFSTTVQTTTSAIETTTEKLTTTESTTTALTTGQPTTQVKIVLVSLSFTWKYQNLTVRYVQ